MELLNLLRHLPQPVRHLLGLDCRLGLLLGIGTGGGLQLYDLRGPIEQGLREFRHGIPQSPRVLRVPRLRLAQGILSGLQLPEDLRLLRVELTEPFHPGLVLLLFPGLLHQPLNGLPGQVDGIGDAVIGQAQGGHRLVELRNLFGDEILLGGGLVFHLQQPLQSRGGGLHRVPLPLDGGQQLLAGGLRLLEEVRQHIRRQGLLHAVHCRLGDLAVGSSQLVLLTCRADDDALDVVAACLLELLGRRCLSDRFFVGGQGGVAAGDDLHVLQPAHQPGGLLHGAPEVELGHGLAHAPDHHRGAHLPGVEGQRAGQALQGEGGIPLGVARQPSREDVVSLVGLQVQGHAVVQIWERPRRLVLIVLRAAVRTPEQGCKKAHGVPLLSTLWIITAPTAKCQYLASPMRGCDPGGDPL